MGILDLTQNSSQTSSPTGDSQGALPKTVANSNVLVSETSEGVKTFEQVETDKNVLDISENLNEKIEESKVIQGQSGTSLNTKNYNLSELLQQSISLGASDIHFTAGYRAIVRVDGKLRSINSQVLSPGDVNSFVEELLRGRENIDKDKKEIDIGYSFQGIRFRANIFQTMGHSSIACRVIPQKIYTPEELRLPEIIKKFTNVPNGLILVTGPTGSGKTTTIASVLNLINMQQEKHIITLEDPVEYIFPKGLALVDQREFGTDFSTWPSALRSMLRQDPDVVLVGEMRDLETISSTMTVAETGHLVFATLHTNSASQSIDRIIDVFPENQQSQVRAQLANVIVAIISQRLVPLEKGGRKAVMEIMITNSAIENAIREGKTYQIDNMIQTGQNFGMISLEKSLVELIRSGEINVQTAKTVTTKPDELDLLLGNTK